MIRSFAFTTQGKLHTKHGYLIATGAMISSTLATYWYFKKKKWF